MRPNNAVGYAITAGSLFASLAVPKFFDTRTYRFPGIECVVSPVYNGLPGMPSVTHRVDITKNGKTYRFDVPGDESSVHSTDDIPMTVEGISPKSAAIACIMLYEMNRRR